MGDRYRWGAVLYLVLWLAFIVGIWQAFKQGWMDWAL